MAKQYKVIYERNNCIGAGTCVAVLDARWKMNDDGKADLNGGVKKGDIYELIITEAELPKMLESAEACPVLVIHIEDMETGKRLI
ncbi:MAG: ferredoxin [Nanoarchaeota archaeon]